MALNTLNESTYCGFAISTYDELDSFNVERIKMH